MIVIKDISLDFVGAIDEEIGFEWRNVVAGGMGTKNVNVELAEAVILKAHDDGTLVLDLGGDKAIIASGSYREVVIS